MLDPLSIACSSCGALAGQRCQTARGDTTSPHRARCSGLYLRDAPFILSLDLRDSGGLLVLRAMLDSPFLCAALQASKGLQTPIQLLRAAQIDDTARAGFDKFRLQLAVEKMIEAGRSLLTPEERARLTESLESCLFPGGKPGS